MHSDEAESSAAPSRCVEPVMISAAPSSSEAPMVCMSWRLQPQLLNSLSCGSSATSLLMPAAAKPMPTMLCQIDGLVLDMN